MMHFKMLAYLFRFKSKQGFLIHPVKFNETHRASSLTLYNDDSIKLTIMPFTVPEIKGSFEKFRAAMREEENNLKRNLIV